MKNLSDLLRRWLGWILLGAWMVLSFSAKQLFGGFVADAISKHLSEITGVHEGDIETKIYSNLVIFIIIGVLLLVVYAAGRWKSVTERSPARLENTLVSRHSYMTAADTIKYIADESEWGRGKLAQPPNERGLREYPRFTAPGEFVRAAREGEIVVLGCPNGTGEHQRIAQTYWLYHTVDLETVIAGDQAGSTISTSPVHQETFNRYDMLTVDRSEVSRIWPRPRRALSRFWFRQKSA